MQIKVNVETGQVKIMPNKKLGTIVTMTAEESNKFHALVMLPLALRYASEINVALEGSGMEVPPEEISEACRKAFADGEGLMKCVTDAYVAMDGRPPICHALQVFMAAPSICVDPFKDLGKFPLNVLFYKCLFETAKTCAALGMFCAGKDGIA